MYKFEGKYHTKTGMTEEVVAEFIKQSLCELSYICFATLLLSKKEAQEARKSRNLRPEQKRAILVLENSIFNGKRTTQAVWKRSAHLLKSFIPVRIPN